MVTREKVQGFLDKLQADYLAAKTKAVEAQASVEAHVGALQAVKAVLELWDEPDEPVKPVLVEPPDKDRK